MSVQVDDFFTPLPEGSQASSQAPQDDFFTPVKEPSRARSLLGAFPKGVLQAVQSINPFQPPGPISGKGAEKAIERIFPTQEKLPEQLLQRGGKLATFLAGGRGSLVGKAARAGVGALAGQTVKELGGGEIAQDIAELSSMALPDLAKQIPAKQAQQRVVNFLRQKGFTENEITPLLQSPKKLARYAKFATKSEKTNKLMRDIYGKFDNVYSSIREQGQNLPGLTTEQLSKFEGEFQKTLDKIPKYYRKKMTEEIADLNNSPMKFSDFIDFYQAINAEIGPVKGGRAVLGTLKAPIENAMKELSPELAKDYQLANELYGKRIDVTKHLRTSQIDDLIDLGEAGALIGGIADQNLGLIGKVLGISGARRLAREMLINPRLQNKSLRMLEAVKKNHLPLAIKLYESFKEDVPEEIRDEMP